MAGTSRRIEPDSYQKDVTDSAKWLARFLLAASLAWGSWITLYVVNLRTDVVLTMDRQNELKAYHVRMEQQLTKLSDKLETHK